MVVVVEPTVMAAEVRWPLVAYVKFVTTVAVPGAEPQALDEAAALATQRVGLGPGLGRVDPAEPE